MTFTPKRNHAPKYLLDDPKYNGGVDKQWQIRGNDESQAVHEGWMLRRYDAAVQDGHYSDVNQETGKRATVAELLNFGRDDLKLDYIFWCTEEPYYSQELIPFMRTAKRG